MLRWTTKEEIEVQIEDHLSCNNPQQVWQGIQNITNYRGCDVTTGNSDMSLAEELNCFFARFETSLIVTAAPPHCPPAPGTPTLTLEEHDVRRVLRAVNPRKAAGPDGIPGKVLKA